eukprot:10905871-Alexandrium_andersonii.AAC.1
MVTTAYSGGPHTKPFAAWGNERKIRQEDWILLENTPEHPSEELLQRYLPADKYAVWSFKLCPSQGGFPMTRQRRFT